MNSDHRLTPSEKAQVEKWLATEPEFRNVRANYGKLRADFEKMYSDHRLTPSERAQVKKWLATEPESQNVRANNKPVYGKLRADSSPLFARTSRESYDDHEEGRYKLYLQQVCRCYRQCKRLMRLLAKRPRQTVGVRGERQIEQQRQQIQQQWRQLKKLLRLTLKKMQAKTSGTRNDDHEEQRTGEDLIELYSGQVLKYYRERQRLLQLVEQPPPQADGVRQILQQWRKLHQQRKQLEELRRLRTITKMQAIQMQAVEDKYRLLTSFLFRDNSFLTPWNWDPENRSAQGERIVFEPGSFFSHDEPVTR